MQARVPVRPPRWHAVYYAKATFIESEFQSSGSSKCHATRHAWLVDLFTMLGSSFFSDPSLFLFLIMLHAAELCQGLGLFKMEPALNNMQGL